MGEERLIFTEGVRKVCKMVEINRDVESKIRTKCRNESFGIDFGIKKLRIYRFRVIECNIF